MSVYNLWEKQPSEPKLKATLSSEWNFKSPIATPRSASPLSKAGEAIFNNYMDLIHSKSNLSTEAKQVEPLERPFDFFDDEEFAFGINLLNNNVACVGDNITKLIQMGKYSLIHTLFGERLKCHFSRVKSLSLFHTRCLKNFTSMSAFALSFTRVNN